jgi:hypothetical protein
MEPVDPTRRNAKLVLHVLENCLACVLEHENVAALRKIVIAAAAPKN